MNFRSFVQTRLAAMTPEERAAFEAERAREERREQRKGRMIQSQLGVYGSNRRTSFAAAGPRRSFAVSKQ
ncbi:hypothetical protein EON62_04975 [archaeon]|nr:MAG: hypothetical protein EON62_04975 [archaeon]